MAMYLLMRGIETGKIIIDRARFLNCEIFEEIVGRKLDWDEVFIIDAKDIPKIIEYYENLIEGLPLTESVYLIKNQIIPNLKAELPKDGWLYNNTKYVVMWV